MKSLKTFVGSLLSAQPVRYLISSCICFAIDYAALIILDRLIGGAVFLSMEVSVALAFALSSQINFWINRLWVFRSDKSPLPEMGGYYSFALVSFSVKFVIIEISVRLIGLSLFVARPIAEAVMFAINYLVQKTLIFRRKNK